MKKVKKMPLYLHVICCGKFACKFCGRHCCATKESNFVLNEIRICTRFLDMIWAQDWIGLSSVLRPRQHSIGQLVKRPNQQYQSTEGTNSTQTNQTYNKQTWTQNTASPLVYTNMGWLGDGFHRGHGCQAWMAVGLPPRYPLIWAQKAITSAMLCYSDWYITTSSHLDETKTPAMNPQSMH